MSNYKRVTRECTLEQLRPELRQAIREHLAERKLVGLEVDIVMCCETVSERQKMSALGALVGDDPDQIYYTGALITPHWLVWARCGDKTGITVVSAQLEEIHVKSFASLLVKDAGLEVLGRMGEAHLYVRGYIGMGPEAAAQKFCEVVKQAVDKVNPPRSVLDQFMLKRK
jgi:hypothetical protein